MNHTPGPWKMIYVGGGDWDLQGPVTQEDWTLAAAAPDMLEALDLLLRYSLSHPIHTDQSQFGNVYDKARAAIAKARGEA